MVLIYISVLVGFLCEKLHSPMCLHLHLHTPPKRQHTVTPNNSRARLMLITSFNVSPIIANRTPFCLLRLLYKAEQTLISKILNLY